jgi:anti-sigma B factor antagonist
MATHQPPVGTTPRFAVAVSHDSSQSRIEACGELDPVSAPELDAALTKAARGGHATTVIVDLRWLTFCDAAGLGLLVSHHYALAAAGGRLVIMHPTPQVEHLILLNHLEDVLDTRAPTRPSRRA